MTNVVKKVPIVGQLLTPPKTPTVAESEPMPLADEEALTAARRRRASAARATGGRASTILSDSGDGGRTTLG